MTSFFFFNNFENVKNIGRIFYINHLYSIEFIVHG